MAAVGKVELYGTMFKAVISMSKRPKIFVSVGFNHVPTQDLFISAVEVRLRNEGFEPVTVGRNSFTASSPFGAIGEEMAQCSGIVIIALERLYLSSGVERRNGTQQTNVTDIKIPTVWNQIEATMAYVRGMPMLVIVEEGTRDDGLLKPGYDWYVQRVKVDAASLNSTEFIGVFADWKKKVGVYIRKRPLTSSRVAENTTRMTFTVMYWFIATSIASIIFNKTIIISSLDEPLKAFFSERVDLGMITFQVVILCIMSGSVLIIPNRLVSNEIRNEAFRLWYTLGSVAGAIGIYSEKYAFSLYSYMFGVILPWILMATNVLGAFRSSAD